MALDQAEELIEVEARHRHDRRARLDPHVHDHLLPVDVEEREDADQHVLTGHRQRSRGLDDVGDEIPVGQHHALRQPGRPARVRQDREVGSRIDLDLGRRGSLREQVAETRLIAIAIADDDDLLDRRVGGGGASGLEEGADGEHQPRAGVVHLVSQLARRVERVRGRADGATPGHAVEDQRVLGQVRHVDRDPVALADPSGRQRAGQCRGGHVQLRERELAAARPVDQRRLVPTRAGVGENEAGDVDVRDLDSVGFGRTQVGSPVQVAREVRA